MKTFLKKPLVRYTFFAFLFSLFQPVHTNAQSFDPIVSAFKAGNAAGVAANFGLSVELTIKNTGNSYSNNQAEMILRNFFNTNLPKSFTVAHQGTSPEGSKFLMGNMVSANGTFRTYIYAKPVNGKLQIQEIRIEE